MYCHIKNHEPNEICNRVRSGVTTNLKSFLLMIHVKLCMYVCIYACIQCLQLNARFHICFYQIIFTVNFNPHMGGFVMIINNITVNFNPHMGS